MEPCNCEYAVQLREALTRIEEWTWERGYEERALMDLQGIARAARSGSSETPFWNHTKDNERT
jgi:hypothetical protein